MEVILEQILQGLQEVKEGQKETNQRLGKLELTMDNLEQKVDKLEEKADNLEQKVDKLEEKADNLEQKVDKLEEKADNLEQRTERIEDKLDGVVEQTADLLEFKTYTTQMLWDIKTDAEYLMHRETQVEKEVFMLKQTNRKK